MAVASATVVGWLLRSLRPSSLRGDAGVRAGRLVEATTARIEGRCHMRRRHERLLLLPLVLRIVRVTMVRRRRHLIHLNRVKIVDIETNTADFLQSLGMRRMAHIRSAELRVQMLWVQTAVSRRSACLMEQLRRNLLQIVEVEVHVLQLLLMRMMVDRSSCVHRFLLLSLLGLILLLLHALIWISEKHLTEVYRQCKHVLVGNAAVVTRSPHPINVVTAAVLLMIRVSVVPLIWRQIRVIFVEVLLMMCSQERIQRILVVLQ